MIIDQTLIGKFINMRSVSEEDAEYILQLRLDSNNSQFVSKTENDLSKQVAWIRDQRIRPNDYYFMFTDKQGSRVGVISLYNIENDHAESGRFISFGNGLQNMEAVLMHYDFAYYTLGISLVHFSVYKDNKKVVSMWNRLGAEIKREELVNNIESYYFELTSVRYEQVFKPNILLTLDKIRS